MKETAGLNSWPYSVESLIQLSARKAHRGSGEDPTMVDPEVKASFKALQNLRTRYFKLRTRLRGCPRRLEAAKTAYLVRRDVLRKQTKEAVDSAVREARDSFENDLTSGVFSWGLKAERQFKKKGRPGEVRYIYAIPNDLKVRLPELQASAIVRAGAKVTPQSRDSMVRALQHALERPYSHGVLKLDISKYFESISHSVLLEKVKSIRGADSTTISLVESLLEEYKVLSGESTGVPQGVGLSAQLAELYLSDFDHRIRTHAGVIYYARYVDDVIVVLDSHESLFSVESTITALLNVLGLDRNQAKDRRVLTARDGEHPLLVPPEEALDYLGYRFQFISKALQTSLTENRVNLRKRRLSRAFEAWAKVTPDPLSPNFARDGLLMKRLRFLAGNARLDHSKSNVVVGIYFSNSALPPDAPQLKELDAAKNELVECYRHHMRSGFASQLEDISFVEGFKDRSFVRFRKGEMERVFSCWKDLT